MAAVANGNVVTRTALIAAWRAAQRRADAEGAVVLNAASAAGQALDFAEGDPVIAATMLPDSEGTFWGLVRNYLERVTREEEG